MGGRKEFFEGRGEDLEMLERKREEGEIEMGELIKRERNKKRRDEKEQKNLGFVVGIKRQGI